MALLFDRVIVSDDGSDRELSVSEFLAIALPERIRLILGRNVVFYLGRAPVELAAALRSLRQEAAALSRLG